MIYKSIIQSKDISKIVEGDQGAYDTYEFSNRRKIGLRETPKGGSVDKEDNGHKENVVEAIGTF